MKGTDAPDIVAFDASDVTNSAALLNGIIIANDLETKYWFEYVTDEFSYKTEEFLLNASDDVVQISAKITGLKPSTNYVYHIVAKNAKGILYSVIKNFKTAVR